MGSSDQRIIIVDRSDIPRDDHDAVQVLEGRNGFRLRSKAQQPLDLQVKISNYYSRELVNEKVRIRPEEDFPLDLSQQREGIYLFRMGFPDGNRDERMIIKVDR